MSHIECFIPAMLFVATVTNNRIFLKDKSNNPLDMVSQFHLFIQRLQNPRSPQLKIFYTMTLMKEMIFQTENGFVKKIQRMRIITITKNHVCYTT